MTTTKWLYAKWKADSNDESSLIKGGWEIFDFDVSKWTPKAIVEWIFKQHPIKEIDELDVYEMLWEQED